VRIGQSSITSRELRPEYGLISSVVEANAGCYFIIDFGPLIPGLNLPDGASALDGEVAIMERMISSGVHIVSTASLVGSHG